LKLETLNLKLETRNSKRRLGVAAIWAALAAVASYVYLFEPGKAGFFPACPFHTLTGLNCPGCGTTRALRQLLHGNVLAAFKLNPLTMSTLPVLVGVLVLFTRSAITGQPVAAVSLPPKLIWVWMFVVFGFWVFRNTPLYPFPA
jgi:hypothetical protein